MSSSDSNDTAAEPSRHPEHSAHELDPLIAEAVDGVTNRFGVEGLEQMIAYAEESLVGARAALERLGDET